MTKKADHKTPTIGQIVWYFPAPMPANQKAVPFEPNEDNEPFAAIVTHTNPDDTVNIGVWSAGGGQQYGMQNVRIFRSDHDMGEPFVVCWPEDETARKKEAEVRAMPPPPEPVLRAHGHHVAHHRE